MPNLIAFAQRTPRLGLPYLFAGQAQKEFFVNEAHALLDSLVPGAVLGERANPPTDSEEGDTWIVGQSATGAWEGHESELASWQNQAWLFVPPQDGMRCYDIDAGQFALFAGGWQRPSEPAGPASGTTEDTELRSAFTQLIEALRIAGIFPVT